MPEPVAEGCSHRVSRSRFVEQMRVGADRDVGVRVSELSGDVHRIELQPDDQQRRESVAECVGADPFPRMRPIDTNWLAVIGLKTTATLGGKGVSE